MSRLFVRGDTHGNFDFLPNFCRKNNTTIDDYLLILGDAGINYHGGRHDKKLKKFISLHPIKILAIHGNHENRPRNIDSYSMLFLDNPYEISGWVYQELMYPNILFLINGFHSILNKKCLVLDGAYSVDKFFRLQQGLNWWEDEQISIAEQIKLKSMLSESKTNYSVDYVFSHTCPVEYQPTHLFLPMIDQNSVDKTTEYFLSDIEKSISYKHWYFGHFHGNEDINDNVTMLFDKIIQLV